MCIRDRYQRRVHGFEKENGVQAVGNFAEHICTQTESNNVSTEIQTDRMESSPLELKHSRQISVASTGTEENLKFEILKKEDDKSEAFRHKKTIDTACLLYTSPSPRDLSTSRMPSSA
eukprot:TRINITY_DN47445_c0_g1_i1.p3 TRINITY_DN47445_c0_g1~~TRINITY_DN47445_c0_g1_i1.p3  ORF type:complete len:118 (+),score=38.21 TRINITY_DN47445_c0_g1_i1:175-528(+)